LVTVADAVNLLRDYSSHHFATRPNWVAELSLAGAMSSVTPLGG
jgi:hypothetical protein